MSSAFGATRLRAMEPTLSIRRVVTAHDASGKAVVLHDGPAPEKRVHAERGTVVSPLWSSEPALAAFERAGTEAQDRALRPGGIAPPARGSSFRIVDFHPAAPGAPPYVHRTSSIDYAVVLTGSIYLLLDDSEVLLWPGDVVVQQATNHAWVNRGSVPCRIAFVLIDVPGA